MFCNSCNYPIRDHDALFCPECGKRLDKENGCAVCGKPYEPNAKFCGRCGTPVGGNIARCWSPLYCKESGSATLPGNYHFRYKACNGIFLEAYRFTDQPVYIHCAGK